MELRDKVKKVFNHFERREREKRTCGEYLCGTCGGRVGAIRSLLDEEENLRNEVLEIFEATEDLDMESVQIIYKWIELLEVGLSYLRFGRDESSLIHKKLYVIIDRMTPILEEQMKKEISQKDIRKIDN